MFLGSENIQAAQKFITGLEARRLSKLPEQRYLVVIKFNLYMFFRKCSFMGPELRCRKVLLFFPF